MEGLALRWDDSLFFERSLDFAAAQATMATEFPADFALLDAYMRTPDGMVGVMGVLAPLPSALLCQWRSACFRRSRAESSANFGGLLSAHPRSQILAGERQKPLEVNGDDSSIDGWRWPHSNDFCGLLSFLAVSFYEFTGRGQLFLPRFDHEAFPLVQKPTWFVSAMRSWIRWSLSLQFIGRR
jgi:hypothetical protein